jgi:hypothetical protein
MSPVQTYAGRRPAGEGSLEIDPLWGVDLGDADVWARNITKAKHRKKKTTIKAVDLENALTGIHVTDTMAGSSTIGVSFEDPDWKLVDSGFFDVNADGKLDPIDVNYPDESELWWRCTQVQITANRAGAKIEMTFLERTVAYLLRRHGPKKTRRSKHTRAEFLKSLVDDVKADGGLRFRSRQLHVRQPVGKPPPDPKRSEPSKKEQKDNKDKGIHEDDNVTIKGVKATAHQLENIRICFDQAEKDHAPELAIQAMCCAGIQESLFKSGANDYDTGTHRGVFQSNQIPPSQTRVQCHYFLTGGRSFKAGGAIAMAKAGNYSAGEIAAAVEVSGDPGAVYGQWMPEAKKMIEAGAVDTSGSGGDPSGGGHYETKPFHFEVGSSENPRESYWDAMGRLADSDVHWALFVDGRNVYFDPETSLIRQKPAAVITRLHPAVVSFTANWDTRQIATEATLELVCSPFEFRAGDVLKLSGFGPASSGSNVKLPGRWLVSEIDRDRFPSPARTARSGPATFTAAWMSACRPARPASRRSAAPSRTSRAPVSASPAGWSICGPTAPSPACGRATRSAGATASHLE